LGSSAIDPVQYGLRSVSCYRSAGISAPAALNEDQAFKL